MSTKPNNRSDAALRERLEIAGKATPGPWYHVLAAIVGTRESPDDNDATCICFTEWGCSGDPQANAAHIAASSPDVVQADIEEILRLREEVARLNKEADWFIEYIWNKDIFRCPMPEGYKCEHKFKHICCLDSEETEIRGRCWREAARKAVEEKERHG